MIVADRRRAALAALVAALAIAPPARAQSAGERANVAEALFRDGVKLFDAGRIHEACGKFAESFRLDPANGTLLNAALCHERDGKIASAWAEFAQLAGRAAQAGQKEREQLARARAAALEPRVPRVRLAFAGDARAIASVTVDGQALGRDAWTTPLPLDPGEHAFAFRAAGGDAAERQVTVPADATTLTVDVPALGGEAPAAAPEVSAPIAPDPAPPPPPTSDVVEGHGRRTVTLALAGAGVVAVGVGAWLGLRTIANKNDGDARCDGRLCDATGLALEDAAHRDALWSTIAFGVGAAAIGGAAWLWLTTPPKQAATAAPVRVRPTVGPRVGGVALEGRW